MSEKSTEASSKRRAAITHIQFNEFPDTYIKAKCLSKVPGKAQMMAGFEMGDPEPKLVRDPRTGKKRLKVMMNGYLRIEPNGDCLILDTPFNRLKLMALCKPGTIKVPKDSKGERFDVVAKGPDFMVEDESIFEGLEALVEVATAAKVADRAVKAPKLPQGKGLVPAAQVEAGKAAASAEKTDNSDGIGGGRRPEMANPGDLKLDIVE